MFDPSNKPNIMKAAICSGSGQPLTVTDVAVPEPGAGELLIKLESCGICHSDVHLRDGDENLPDALYPLILGHEGIGRVVTVGQGSSNPPAIGTRVGLPWLYDTCMSCKPCLSGAETFCQSQTVRGIEHHGGFAEYAIVDVRYSCEIPQEIDPLTGAPLLCAGLTAWAALRKTRLEPSSNVLIIGSGGLGQYAIVIAKSRGARVFVIDNDPSKLESAKYLGANAVFLAGPDSGIAVKDAGGADVVLNFAPTPSVWKTIEAAVNPMSDIVAIALVHDPVELSMMWLLDGGHRVFGSSVGTRQELRDFLSFAARNPINVDIESIPLSQVDTALNRLKSGNVKGRLCIDFTL